MILLQVVLQVLVTAGVVFSMFVEFKRNIQQLKSV